MMYPANHGSYVIIGCGSDIAHGICVCVWMYIYIYIHIMYIYILAWFKTYEFIYGASPAAGCAARAREHLTRARARCASNGQARARDARANRGARAREVREQGQEARACSRARPSDTRARANKLSARAKQLSKSQISSPNPLLESLFARARVSDGCAREHARASWPCSRTSRARASICSRVSRARLSVLAHLARACVKCSRACARTISTGNVSSVLKNDNIYTYNYI